MNTPLLEVRTRLEAGALAVLAPRIGFWSEHPPGGALLGPGSAVGRLRQLNRQFVLVLPEGVRGRVLDGLPRRRVLAVEYGQPLFCMVPLDTAEAGLPEGQPEVFGHPADADLPPGCRAIVAPTDGVFYRRSGPDATAFVEVGDSVRLGQTVGLVEVMKTFNQIAYEGPGFPQCATVEAVREQDGAEVRAGQVLFVLR